MRLRPAAGLALALLASQPAAGQGVEALVRGLAPGGAPASVRVDGRIERDGERAELVVTLTPEGGARLVADPGVQVVALAGPAGPWAVAPRAELVRPGGGYFDAPVELRLAVAPTAAGEASAEVAYAWCVVERICLFGDATVRVALPEAGG
jgi:hypothetical protein